MLIILRIQRPDRCITSVTGSWGLYGNTQSGNVSELQLLYLTGMKIVEAEGCADEAVMDALNPTYSPEKDPLCYEIWARTG